MASPLKKRLFLVSTETSGDLLGARMVSALKKDIPDLQLSGVGGEGLLAEGMQAHYQVRDFNVMGLFEVLSQLKRLKAIFADLVQKVRDNPPDLIVLVDAPDFNLRFAKAVRDLGVPIIYYVSPQVWAWRKKRAKEIAHLVDHIMVLFEFELEIYEREGLAATWTGHPLVDECAGGTDRDTFFSQHNFDPNKPLVALAPGSRPSEIKRHLPVIQQIARERGNLYQLALPIAPALDIQNIQTALADVPIKLLPGKMRPLMRHADAAIVASGTATLETGLLQTPMIVGYKLKTMSYWLARFLVKLPYIALVNIVLDKAVVPELIQGDFSAERVLPILDRLVNGGEERMRMLAEFARLEQVLGGSGASERAARVVKDFLSA